MNNNFKACRISRHLSVSEVSQKIGISNQAIDSIEKGKNNPSTNTLLQFAELYEVSTDYLLGRTTFDSFRSQYEYLQSLEQDGLFDALDQLNINEWTTKKGDNYSKINGDWYITIKNSPKK